jgi:hypothetical protein
VACCSGLQNCNEAVEQRSDVWGDAVAVVHAVVQRSDVASYEIS